MGVPVGDRVFPGRAARRALRSARRALLFSSLALLVGCIPADDLAQFPKEPAPPTSYPMVAPSASVRLRVVVPREVRSFSTLYVDQKFGCVAPCTAWVPAGSKLEIRANNTPRVASLDMAGVPGGAALRVRVRPRGGIHVRRRRGDPLDDVQVLTPVKKRALGVEELNRELSALQNPGALRNHRGFGRGDKVIQTRNDYELDVYNGDLGRVVALPDPEVDGAGLAVEVDGQKKSYTGEASLSLELAYAITIHKSQGSEYPAVVIPWMRAHAHMLTRNLLYTAITRGKRMVVVVTEPGALAMALAERRRIERRTTLRERLRRLVVG